MKREIKEVCTLGVIFLVIDQVIKLVLNNMMSLNQSIVVVKNFFSITLVHNTGAAFSILTGNRFLLIFIGIIVLVGLVLYLKNIEYIVGASVFIYALLTGGILGNLVDRIIYGYVVDFLSFNFGNYFFPIFNFADIFIIVSIILMLVRMVREDLWK